MNVSRTAAFFAATLALGVVAKPALGGTQVPTYTEAPLSRYLDADRKTEVALARTAAPPSISLHASVLVLTAHGYETADQGGNGFTCLVERAWTKAFDDDQFWNSKVRAPVCYNPSASRTVLPYTFFATKMVLAGATEAQILDRLRAAVAGKELPATAAGSMAYMMSKDQYIDDSVKAWYPHVMMYAPKADGANAGESWGADRRGSPVVYDNVHLIWPQPWAVMFVPVWRWSDGSPGPILTAHHH